MQLHFQPEFISGGSICFSAVERSCSRYLLVLSMGVNNESCASFGFGFFLHLKFQSLAFLSQNYCFKSQHSSLCGNLTLPLLTEFILNGFVHCWKANKKQNKPPASNKLKWPMWNPHISRCVRNSSTLSSACILRGMWLVSSSFILLVFFFLNFLL